MTAYNNTVRHLKRKCGDGINCALVETTAPEKPVKPAGLKATKLPRGGEGGQQRSRIYEWQKTSVLQKTCNMRKMLDLNFCVWAQSIPMEAKQVGPKMTPLASLKQRELSSLSPHQVALDGRTVVREVDGSWCWKTKLTLLFFSPSSKIFHVKGVGHIICPAM